MYTSQFFSETQSETIDNSFTEITLVHASANTYSDVYKAKRHGKWHILKCITQEKQSNPRYQLLLKKEFGICYQLDHPNLVKTVGIEDVDGIGTCIIEEYIEGISWDDYFSSQSVSSKEAIRIICELCDALAYIHKRQIVHRDIKPTNIIITHDGHHPKLIDFGLADGDAYAILKEPAGSAHYIAPEQISASLTDCRCDIYSFGKVIELLPALPRTCRRIIKRCLLPVEQRYQSISEVKEAFHKVSTRRGNIVRYAIFVTVVIIQALLIYGVWQSGKNAKTEVRDKDNGVSMSERIATQYDPVTMQMYTKALELFLQQRPWLQSTINESLDERDDFVRTFPISELKNLPRKDYEMNNPDGFSNRIKYTMAWLGAFYEIDSKPYECEDMTDEEYRQHLNNIVNLLSDGAVGNIKAIHDNPLYPPLKYRLLTIYYPESSYMPFWLDSEVDHMVDVLLPDTVTRNLLTPANCVDKREILSNYKNAHPIMKEWSNFLFMDFLFMYFPKCSTIYNETVKRKIR